MGQADGELQMAILATKALNDHVSRLLQGRNRPRRIAEAVRLRPRFQTEASPEAKDGFAFGGSSRMMA
jgi:hypothetical protein